MGAQAGEGPGEVGLRVDTDGTAGGVDAQESGHPVGAFGAPREEPVVPELREALELSLGRRVVDGDLGVTDKAKESLPVVPVVPDRLREVVVRR